ncbi:MAG: ABC transporter ATP-binding protein [Candidatus Omnitrophota bacterium]
MKIYLRLLSFVKPHIKILSWAAVFMLFNSVVTNGVSISMVIPLVDKVIGGKDIILPAKTPVFLQDIVGRINHIPASTLFQVIVYFLIGAFFLKGVFTFLQQYLMADASVRVLTDLRNRVYEKLLGLSLDFYTKTHTGNLVSRVTYDTSIIQNSITEGLTDLFFQTFQIIVCIIMIFSVRAVFGIDWLLLILSFIVLPAIMYPIVRVGKKLKKISTGTQEQMGLVTSTLFETISGMRVVKAFGMEGYERDKFAKQNDRLYKLFLKSAKREQLIGPVTEFIGIVCAVLVLWLGGKKVISGELSAGAFIAFLMSLMLLVRPFNRLSRIYSINQKALAAAERTFEILDTRASVAEAKGAIEFSSFSDKIVFKGVNFNYGGEPVLKSINLEVKKGDVLAIVGHSGSGKSTLVNLIPRFYDPCEGQILIDGHSIKDITIKSLRDQIGIVTQETILFHDTVRANISYGRIDACDESIARAAKIANAHDFISKLPEGYHTIVGERGHRLSGGERQRLAIARAVLKDEPILILDEATSQLDMGSEALVQEAIEKLMKGRTVFVIAHRLSTIKFATKIVVLETGEIAESGTHEELLRRNGLYKKIYDLQFFEEGSRNIGMPKAD